MSAITRTHLACVLGLLVTAGQALGAAPPASGPDYRLSGPFSHDNLAVFFLHGPDPIQGKKFLTLDEALRARKVIVHETKQVHQLAIENVSTEEVFVQAGDIVKGGQQDRTIANDLVVPPRSGKVPLASFCVEQGRWSKRGGEDTKVFNGSSYGLVGNSLKLATRKLDSEKRRGTQMGVWRNVTQAQMQLEAQLKADVKSKDSQTSLQLTLENRKLLEAVAAYVKPLERRLDRQTDVIGYAAAINGKVNSADVYANADLFRKLWPKMLRSSAVEALVARQPGSRFEPARAATVRSFLAEVRKGKVNEKTLLRDLEERQQETERNILIETRCRSAVLRRSYLAK